MIPEKDFENYVKILSSDEDADAIEQAIQELAKSKKEIFPKLIGTISHEQSNWHLRYHFLKVIEQIGVESDQDFDTIEKLLENEKDKTIAKKMLAILSQASIKKCSKEFPKDISKKVMNWKEIYSFDVEEISDLTQFLEEQEIPYRQILFQHGHPKVASSYIAEYVLQVPEDKFMAAVDGVREFLGMNETWTFSGNCPACGTRCKEKKQCPECKLKLEIDPLVELVEHPFISFLYRERLLDSVLQEHPMRSVIEKHIQRVMEHS